MHTGVQVKNVPNESSESAQINSRKVLRVYSECRCKGWLKNNFEIRSCQQDTAGGAVEVRLSGGDHR